MEKIYVHLCNCSSSNAKEVHLLRTKICTLKLNRRSEHTIRSSVDLFSAAWNV